MIYLLKARIYPSFLCLFPFIVFFYYYLNEKIPNFIKFVSSINWVDDAIYLVVIIYLFSQISRIIGKELFEKVIFKNELNFPTTSLLTRNSKIYSEDYKIKIKEKVRLDFGLVIDSIDNSGENLIEQKKKIVEAVSHIRAKVGNGRLVLQHNIEYGFIRNLMGGSLVALLMSLFDILFFKQFEIDNTAFLISIILFSAYFIVILFSKSLIARYGYLYAKVLFQEYMN